MSKKLKALNKKLDKAESRGYVQFPYSPEPGERKVPSWHWKDDSEGRRIAFVCACGAVLDDVRTVFTIAQDGKMMPNAYHEECGYCAFIQLAGWPGEEHKPLPA